MRTHGVSVYPEVLQNADVVKVLPDVTVKELKKSANIDFEKDSYTEIQDVGTTIVHDSHECFHADGRGRARQEHRVRRSHTEKAKSRKTHQRKISRPGAARLPRRGTRTLMFHWRES